jgi:tRNA (cmo5U34)-methyltransferase
VGAGDGQEILGLKKTRPSWRVTGVDPSAEMLAVAKARLAEKGFKAELFAGTLSSVPKAEPFDAATSILVMHFVKEPAEKLAFLRDIFARLKKGGAYVHVELCDDNKPSQALPDMQTVWNHFQISKGQSEADLIDRNKRRANSVFPLPPDSVENLFSEAGFSGARLFYKALNFHGWIMARES